MIGWILYLQHPQMRTNQRVGKSGREWGRVSQSGAHVAAVDVHNQKVVDGQDQLWLTLTSHEFPLLGVADLYWSLLARSFVGHLQSC